MALSRIKVSGPSIRIIICPSGEKSMSTTLGNSAYGVKAKIEWHNDAIHLEWLSDELRFRVGLFDTACSIFASKTFEALGTLNAL